MNTENPAGHGDTERITEVIRLIKRALEDCYRLLLEIERRNARIGPDDRAARGQTKP